MYVSINGMCKKALLRKQCIYSLLAFFSPDEGDGWQEELCGDPQTSAETILLGTGVAPATGSFV